MQHSTVLGPTKGGIRYDPHVSLGECAALAMWMTWKCALLRLPYGGAKGGVRCNPRDMSIGEIERLTRRYTSELAPVIGPKEDIPAPDMATNEQTMAWMMDTYSMQIGHAVPEIVTGKPISIGGSVFRHEATGAGVVMVIERACERLGWNLAEQRCIVQGFGKVGGVAAAELADRGATVVGIGDYSGGIYDENGLDVAELMDWTAEGSALADWQGRATHVTNAALLELPCDVLVLAALEDQLTAENAPRIQARMVAEGANGPTSLDADEILLERGIPGAARHPHQRRRRHGLVLRVGSGHRAVLLGSRRDPLAAGGEDGHRLRPRLGALRGASDDVAHGGPRLRDSRGGCRATGPRAVSVTSLVREAMVAEPATLPASATAVEAGDRLAQPDVRAVLVTDGDSRLVGVVTRSTLVREVVAAGRDPRATSLGEIAEAPRFTVDADLPVDEAFQLLETEDLERVPVVEDGKLVGVLSRSVLQRRLAEDEPPELPPRRLGTGGDASQQLVERAAAVVEMLEPPCRAGFAIRVVERSLA